MIRSSFDHRGKAMKGILSSRVRVLLLTIALLALLDLGRSLYARAGYAQPVETWQPDPEIYADIVWPPGSDLPANAPTGQRIYADHCQVCHGPDGRGNGPAAPSLIPRPRDFTLGQFKYKSTAPDQPPSDVDLFHVVSNGLEASAMPYWRDILSDEKIREVVAYIKSFSPVFNNGSPTEIAIPPRVTPDADSVARGKNLFTSQACNTCHGNDGRGGSTLRDTKGYPVISRDLTAPWTFRGGSAPEQIWLRLTTGLAPGPMPSYANNLTPEQRWDLVNYIFTLARTPPWEPGGKFEGYGQQADLTRRGEYLVHANMCGLCHTPINRTGIYRADDAYLAGGMRVGVYPHGVIVSRNLTSDPETGLGDWSEEQIVNALTNGRGRDRILSVFDMPWVYYHDLHPDDAQAIARYLKNSLPAVHNQIPSILRYGIVETLADKLTRPFPAFPATYLTYGDGNWGLMQNGLPRDLPQTILTGAQWLVLVIGLVAFVFGPPTERRFPKRLRDWVLAALVIVGVVILIFVGFAVYESPQLSLIPPDILVGGAVGTQPTLNLTDVTTPEQMAMVQRGQYIYTIAPCALCHGANGSGGELKVSWRPMGTLWVRNITPDLETGIGKWSDAEIARAVRAGVSQDGYALHWQGMPWDHFSNWEEEDIRAVIAYLRVLPPIKNMVLSDRPPAPDDCEVYTFWITASSIYGCK
jgi:mono/diheme cytochrome c family protein